MKTCYVKDGILVCRCGECKLEDFELPSDFPSEPQPTMNQILNIEEEGWKDEFTRYYGALLNKPVCCEMKNNDCGCDGATYLNEITGFIDELLHQQLQKKDARIKELEDELEELRDRVLEAMEEYDT